jgi:hypothetical protein
MIILNLQVNVVKSNTDTICDGEGIYGAGRRQIIGSMVY